MSTSAAASPGSRNSLATEPTVRAAVLSSYGALASSFGIDAADALRAAGLPRDALADPDRRIPVVRLNRLLQATAANAHSESIGLRLAREIHVDSLGILGSLVRHSATAGEAFDLVSRYAQLHNEALSLWTERDGKYLIVREEYFTLSHSGVRECIEMTAGVLTMNFRRIIGPDWNPRGMCFRHAAPADTRVHRDVFRCPIRFVADFDALICLGKDFERRNRLAVRASARDVRRARAMVARIAGDATVPLTRRLIWAMLPSGHCTSTEIARLLGVDRRTLHRHLVRHGESFSALLDAIRTELAARQVGLGLRRLADVSVLLGFRSQSDFSHWFRTHFGAPPGKWRRELLERERSHRSYEAG